MEFLFLFLGLGGLWLGSELTIHGALDIANRHKISQLFIGLTILAFGTDLPELFIDINAAMQKLAGTDTSDLIVGETLGTTMGQLALVLGITCLIGSVTITKRELTRDGLTMLGAIVLLGILGLDGSLSNIDGILMMLIYGYYFSSIFREERLVEKIKRSTKGHFFWAISSIIAGVIFLVYGSFLTVENALLVSESLGIGQHVVGLLMVGVGTSLPELATSIAAVRKGAGTMAAGNIIGSNIFDLLFTLGIGSAIAGFSFRKSLLFFDLPLLFVVSILALILFRTSMKMDKREGLILLAIYVSYFVIRASGVIPE